MLCRKHKCRGRRDAQERPPPGGFPFGESHQSHFAPKGSPASPVPRVSVRPQEVRIRQVLLPDAHVRDPSRTPSGSTSAFPRRSLACGAKETTQVKPWRCWAPYGAPEHRKALAGCPKECARDRACRPPAQGCSAQCPRRMRFRQWAHIAAMSNVSMGAMPPSPKALRHGSRRLGGQEHLRGGDDQHHAE